MNAPLYFLLATASFAQASKPAPVPPAAAPAPAELSAQKAGTLAAPDPNAPRAPIAPNAANPAVPASAAVPATPVAAPVASEASPLAPRHFDQARDIYIGGTTSARIGGSHAGAGGDTSNSLDFGISISTGFFLGRHIALGSKVLFETAVAPGSTQVSFALGPLLTGRFGLSDVAHLLPSVGLLYDVSYAAVSANKQTGNYFLVDVALPFVFELGTGIALSVGPYVTPGFGSLSINGSSGTASQVNYGIRAGVLGWL